MPERENNKNLFVETLDWVCEKLESAGIPYMITGGSAVGFWGHIRTTGGSERQLRDSESIYKLNLGTLDLNYIKKWVKKLKIEEEFNKITL